MEKYKSAALAQARARLKSRGFETGTLELLEMSGEAFAVRAPKMSKGGQPFSYIEIVRSRSTHAERALWKLEQQKQGANPQSVLLSANPPQEPLAMSLVAPASAFPKYLGLLGLMVRDEGLRRQQTQTLTEAEFKTRFVGSTQFLDLAGQILTHIKAGDVRFYALHSAFEDGKMPVNLTSEETKKQRAALAFIEAQARKELVPVLKNLPAVPTKSRVIVTSDRETIEPFFKVSIEREFKRNKTFSAYRIVMSRKNGKVIFDYPMIATKR